MLHDGHHQNDGDILVPAAAAQDQCGLWEREENTTRDKGMSVVKSSDQACNDPGPERGDHGAAVEANANLPILRAVVLDFLVISQIDTTAVQALIDTPNEMERWTDHTVEFRFAAILSPWICRALIAMECVYPTDASITMPPLPQRSFWWNPPHK
ncbi:hypothetical protein EV421DRAFT_1989335 [Armillaria borealis]|uniref:Uncharacterized protein n=1 Tax=Armillaria borealis TaxID=47425 RepID=A0AA39J223_9AGAR|nr:hypothetical protein EV421DRAFT_1989335 [Armillaria borealis]